MQKHLFENSERGSFGGDSIDTRFAGRKTASLVMPGNYVLYRLWGGERLFAIIE